VNGWLDISSHPGKGTSVILSVPLASRHNAPDEGASQ
jgi:chemotaxis protein histidine kinase CheA